MWIILILANSIRIITAIALPKTQDLSPRGRPILNAIDCPTDLPSYPSGFRAAYHNLRNLCAIDSTIRSGNVGCFCANDALYCPLISSPPWLVWLRSFCLAQCNCGSDTKFRGGTTATDYSIDVEVPPWSGVFDVERGPNPFRDAGTFAGTCSSCFIFSEKKVVPRDVGGNCTCANASSVLPRDVQGSNHAVLLDDLGSEEIR